MFDSDSVATDEQVCYSGLFPANAIVIELGGPIRLPATALKNLTKGTMNFTIEWAGIDIAGSGQVAARSLAAGESASLNDLSFEIDGLELGTHKIAIGFGATGAYQVSAERQFDLAVVVPEQLREIIQVPLRYCVVEGSPQALGRKPGEMVDGKKLLSVLREAGDKIWLAQAGIFFRHGFAPQGIPVVADPDMRQSHLQQGDLTTTGFGLGEWADAATACEKAWEELYPGQKGIVVVNGRKIIPETETIIGGVAPGVPYELWVQSADARTGKRGDALCGNPRNLLVSDITYMLKAATYDPALYKIIPYTSPTFEPTKVLAHELGHTLMLGHGNGLDDNADGQLPPTAGRRRFDQYCDVNGQQEDINPPYSLMNSGDIKLITPLQREMARAAAKLVPGAVLPDPVADPAGTLAEAGSQRSPRATLSGGYRSGPFRDSARGVRTSGNGCDPRRLVRPAATAKRLRAHWMERLRRDARAVPGHEYGLQLSLRVNEP